LIDFYNIVVVAVVVVDRISLPSPWNSVSLSLKEKRFDVYGRGAKGIEKDFVTNAHCCWSFRTLEKKKTKKFVGFCFSE